MTFRQDVRAALGAGRAEAASPTHRGTEALRRYLDTAARFSAPVLPPGSRLAGAKRALLRLLRIVTRDQTVCNTGLIEASIGLAGLADRFEEEIASLDVRSRRAEETANRLREELLQLKRELAAERATGSVRFPAISEEPPLRREGVPPEAVSPDLSASSSFDPLYFSFEEAFRGDETAVFKRQEGVIEWIVPIPTGSGGVALPVLDGGCGRGEFLRALAERGLRGFGVDSSPAMVARCREQGLDCRQASLEDALEALGDGSLGALVAFQLIEHLRPEALAPLFRLAYRKLAPGARIVVETVNPESLYALSRFYLDPTHQKPLPAALVRHLLRGVGFADVVVHYRSPVPPAERLQTSGDENLEKLDRLLYGDQDFAVVATR
jgi:SAM-dependent methyltransferase